MCVSGLYARSGVNSEGVDVCSDGVVLLWLGGESNIVGFVCVCFFPGAVKRNMKLNGGCCCRLELIQETAVVLKIPLNVLIRYFLGVEKPQV